MKFPRFWIAASFLLTACGSDESPPSPQEVCLAEDTPIFVTGDLMTDDAPLVWEHRPAEARGLVDNRRMFIELGEVPYRNSERRVILNFVENQASEQLLDMMANATADGEKTLQIIDVSNVPDGASRISLDSFDCDFNEGKACVQVAYDSNQDDVPNELDDKVFHAVGGEITVQAVNNNRSRLQLTFDVLLGKNLLQESDNSEGRVQGCINARYSSAASQGWTLR